MKVYLELYMRETEKPGETFRIPKTQENLNIKGHDYPKTMSSSKETILCIQ